MPYHRISLGNRQTVQKTMKTKYEIKEITGCTAFDFTINGKSLSEFNDDERNEVLTYLFEKIKDGLNEQTILFENVVHLFQPDDWEHDDYVCEQCGDSVSTTIWRL